MKYDITLIAALDPNGVIGYQNRLPWHYPEDLKRFKSLTKGHHVVMGRNTFDSLGQKPLPHRTNIVLSQSYYQSPPLFRSNLYFIPNFNTILDLFGRESLKVIGGQRIYKQFLPLAEELQLTCLYQTYQGDTYFPSYLEDFELVEEDPHEFFVYRHYRRIVKNSFLDLEVS